MEESGKEMKVSETKKLSIDIEKTTRELDAIVEDIDKQIEKLYNNKRNGRKVLGYRITTVRVPVSDNIARLIMNEDSVEEIYDILGDGRTQRLVRNGKRHEFNLRDSPLYPTLIFGCEKEVYPPKFWIGEC